MGLATEGACGVFSETETSSTDQITAACNLPRLMDLTSLSCIDLTLHTSRAQTNAITLMSMSRMTGVDKDKDCLLAQVPLRIASWLQLNSVVYRCLKISNRPSRIVNRPLNMVDRFLEMVSTPLSRSRTRSVSCPLFSCPLFSEHGHGQRKEGSSCPRCNASSPGVLQRRSFPQVLCGSIRSAACLILGSGRKRLQSSIPVSVLCFERWKRDTFSFLWVSFYGKEPAELAREVPGRALTSFVVLNFLKA